MRKIKIVEENQLKSRNNFKMGSQIMIKLVKKHKMSFFYKLQKFGLFNISMTMHPDCRKQRN